MNDQLREKYLAALDAKPFLIPLVDRLRLIGGDFAVIWNETDFTKEEPAIALVKFGRLTLGKTAKLMEMVDNHCHDNAIAFASKYPARYQVESGYGLGPGDLVWRPHSWVWDSMRSQIIETTVIRFKYFGITLSV